VIKIETTQTKSTTPKYPYIGITKNKHGFSDQAIVLFIAKGTGVSLNNSISSDIGEYSETWDEEYFEPSTTSITLSNA
jgi:hypothetical protein